MWRMLSLVVVVCLVCVFAVQPGQAQTALLKVNEAETQAVLQANRLHANLVLENPSPGFAGKVTLEVLDSEDKILASSQTAHAIKSGRQALPLTLNFSLPQPDEADNLLWYRLRYSVARENSSAVTSGIVSLSEIMPELFELQIIAPGDVFAGMRFRGHVLALHPVTKKPVRNVNVTGVISLDLDTEEDEDELKITARGTTNNEGFVSLSFAIPPNAKLDDDGDIIIEGEKNGVRRKLEEDLDVSAAARMYLNLDKPIYQPSQKLFARGLYLNPARLPLAEKELEFQILDEESETVYEATAKTSRFGVASLEWQIPANLKLGKYRIEVSSDGETVGKSEFKVTRYDLPNFSVSAKADRTFYLPGQKSAEIAVGADYLFGKPVTAGKVRIVQETERVWNFEEQEWEIKEAKTYEGVTDAQGKFIAAVDLSEAHENLLADEWKRFEDLHFAAYFTDAGTNRTELKRFDIRVSKEPIHIYFIRHNWDVNPKLSFQFYVSTFYADGTPARCDVEIRGNYPKIRSDKIIAAARTNSYGASKFEIRIPENPFPGGEDNFDLQISARDRQGNVGTFADNLNLDETKKQIFVKTDKTVYLPNENIEAKIQASASEETVLVDVLKNSSVIYSKRVRLSGDGRALAQIPFRPDFKGELTLAAYFKSADEDRPTVHSKTIIYPVPDDLKLNIKAEKDVYRPNEEAKIAFRAQRNGGAAAETALGVVILDKAVEERARTDETPDNYRDLRSLIGTAESFGNLTRRDLNKIDLNQPPDADLQLAAEFLLSNKSYEPHFWETDSYRQDFREIFRSYFSKRLQPFENALKTNYEKTGDYPHDADGLRRILSADGINFDEMRDAWEMPYAVEFRTDRRYLNLTLKTASADKKIGTEDDFVVREMRFDWFTKTHNALTTILNNYTQQTKKVPQTADELKAVWRQAGVDVDALRDGWNRAPYLTSAKYTRTVQKSVLEDIGKLDGETQQVLRIKALQEEVVVFKLRSPGANGLLEIVNGNSDDFDLGAFSVVVSEKPEFDEMPRGNISKIKTASSRGAIGGTIFDPVGAVIPNIAVSAINQSSGQIFTGKSDDNGEYLITNLPPGKYNIVADGQYGFRRTTIENVVISSMNLIKLDIYLQVTGAAAEVTIAEQDAAPIDATNTKITTTSRDDGKSISGRLDMSGANQTSTPRVREYFPETLLWQPELITDKNGRAELKFRFADNLTTWKLYAVGSTEAGEIALVEKELQTFQPFFAELEPPRILTEGDEIALPVPVRNYTDRRQKVSVSMAENSWSSLLNAGGATQQIEIAADSSQNAIFNFRAVAPASEGRQKVTALGAKGEGDTIEKPVTVKPNGREIVRLQSQMFRESAAFEVDFPAHAFPNTRRAELKIYPNLFGHVAESIEGLLKRPYGCGEQTTSSTYPNLMILKIDRDWGRKIDEKTKKQAEIYLRDGYERLLNYQTPGGGFSYWGKTDAPNVALTAYVLRFLNDVRRFITVDEKVVEAAQNWLLSQQKADGSWEASNVNADSSTAYIARALLMNAQPPNEETKKAQRAALDFLKKRLPEIKDAYVLANFALASVAAGDLDTGRAGAEKLNSLAQTDEGLIFWTADATPFYGWGITARIETTALAVQALTRLDENDKFADGISRGLAFLLKNKDRFGVWHSTQTTVNVLDALILLQKLTKDAKRNAAASGGQKAEIFVNGRKVQDFDVDVNALSYPQLIDISPFLSLAANRIEIKNGNGSAFIQAQIVAAHYIPWKDAALQEDARYFDFAVGFDRTESRIGDEITCAVTIKRRTNHYGMALAEIGIPPGADVDRASLENAKKIDENISRYDVLPDRIIVYFWSSPRRPASFKFKFKPRFGINAQAAPSIVYDYYNEEAQATLAPARFIVR